MKTGTHKKYTEQAKRGIKGEAFFESLISEYSLPNQIVGLKDLGIDYICQWVYEDKPSWILYGVQVKTFSPGKRTGPKFIETEKRGFNRLNKYRISNPNLKVDDRTLCYWQSLGMPVYLFAICDQGQKLDCYYRRYTPDLTKDKIDVSKIDSYSSFYKVNDNASFIAFADAKKREGGFARDLFIDYIRWNYFKGFIAYVDPRTIGLNQFPPQARTIFGDLFDIYKDRICETYNFTKGFLEKRCGGDS